MKHAEKPSYLFDNPNNVRRVVRGLIAACVILAGLDLILHRHAAHPWEALIAFYPLYGFVACVLLVLLAKEMRKLVMRDEQYYNETTSPPESSGPEGKDSDHA